MTALRETTKKQIADVLEKTYFTGSSFSIRYQDGASPFLLITFIPERRFSFSVGESPGYNTSGYITEEAPGLHIETVERFKYDSLGNALKAIGPWAERILEDYRSRNPVIDEFEAFRQTLSEQMEAHILDKDAHFTEEEAQALRDKLDELSTKLHEVWKKSEIAEQKLKEAEQEIARIKKDIAVFPKGVWYSIAGGKIVSAVKKVIGSAEGRQFALEAAKKLFLEGPK